jgi:hypothetical protein
MLIRRLGLLIALSALGTAVGPQAAFAEDGKDPVGQCAASASYVCLQAKDPGSAPAAKGPAPSAPRKKPRKKSAPLPCIARKLAPPPPVGSPLWEGHKPGDGDVYVRACAYDAGATAVGAGYGRPGTFWSATTPAARSVDPEVLARRAVERMRLDGPNIQSPRAGGTYVVGMPLWLHVGQSPNTFGPTSKSASAGAVTVTATAEVANIKWSMGDGTTVTCQGPGTAYKPSFGKRPSPDCGHVYTHTSAGSGGKKYTVTARATWQITWTGAGQQGEFTTGRASQVQVPVGELQALG